MFVRQDSNIMTLKTANYSEQLRNEFLFSFYSYFVVNLFWLRSRFVHHDLTLPIQPPGCGKMVSFMFMAHATKVYNTIAPLTIGFYPLPI